MFQQQMKAIPRRRRRKMIAELLSEKNWRKGEGRERRGLEGEEYQVGYSMPSYGDSRREAADHVIPLPRAVPRRATILPIERPLKKTLRPMTP